LFESGDWSGFFCLMAAHLFYSLYAVLIRYPQRPGLPTRSNDILPLSLPYETSCRSASAMENFASTRYVFCIFWGVSPLMVGVIIVPF